MRLSGHIGQRSIAKSPSGVSDGDKAASPDLFAAYFGVDDGNMGPTTRPMLNDET